MELGGEREQRQGPGRVGGFSAEQPGCRAHPRKVPPMATGWSPERLAGRHASAAFVRNQANAETSISDYDVHLPQVLSNELRKLLGRLGKTAA